MQDVTADGEAARHFAFMHACVLGLLVLPIALARLVARWPAASRPTRRTVTPVFVAGCAPAPARRAAGAQPGAST